MVDRPCTFILSGFTLMIIIAGFVAAMGWITPNDPHDRDYMVWGDPYVTEWDKSVLVKRYNNDDEAEIIPLQSQAVAGWTSMLIYSPPSDSVENMWTKDVLMSIREFEKDTRAEEDWKSICLIKTGETECA